MERDDLRRVFDRARRAISEERGLRLTLAVGDPTPSIPRHPVSTSEVEQVIAALRRQAHPVAGVTADFVGFLHATGVRFSAGLTLRRDRLFRGPGGLWCVAVREKATRELRTVLVRAPHAKDLMDRWIRLDHEAPLWQAGGRRLTPGTARRLLRAAAAEAGLDFQVLFHGLRHGVATERSAASGETPPGRRRDT